MDQVKENIHQRCNIMSEQNIKVIIDEIKNLSIDLEKEGHTLTRRELVERINTKFPHLSLKETLAINTLVATAFEDCSYSASLQNSISNSFFSNDGKSKIFDPKRISLIPTSLTLECNKVAFDGIGSLFNKMNVVLEEIQKVDYFLSLRQFEDELKGIKLVEVFSLTGASKVEEKIIEARKVFNNYKGLIDKYLLIRDELSNLFIDFEQLRNALKYMREDLANMVVEVFGEKLKLTNPALFDFSSVKWMETSVLIDKLQVEFQTIEQRSKDFFTLNEDLYTDFGNSALASLKKLNRSRGSISNTAVDIGIDAVFSIVESRNASKNTIKDLDHDIEMMKKSFHNDARSIRMDVMRLLEIFKNVKENFTPTLENFTAQFRNQFENKIKLSFAQIFSISGVKELKDANVVLLNRIKYLDIELHDVAQVVEDTESQKFYYQQKLNDLKGDNDYFIANEPTRPHVITAIISIGIVITIFAKMRQQWNAKTFKTRSDYQNYLELLKLENTRLEFYNNSHAKLQTEQDSCREQVKKNSALIREKLMDESSIQQSISLVLADIIDISKLSKQILETKLEDRLLTAV